MRPWTTSYHEPHSADGKSYIDKRVEHRWEVWFKGTKKATHKLRKDARTHIRLLKKAVEVA